MLWIYFIQSGRNGPIKIGIGEDPEQRRGLLQIGNPEELRLLAVRPGNFAIERLLHRRFAASRIRGEWFRADASGLLEEVRKAAEMEAAIADGHSRFCEHCGQPVFAPRTRICGAKCERERKRRRSAKWRAERSAISPEDQASR